MIPESVHWFRIDDNNPVIVDETTIDSLTYSRSIVANLPDGHGWAANANKAVAASLGFEDTQAVMYSDAVRGQKNPHLTADEVNMVKMAMTGVDSQAGTADDYSIDLQFVADCANAEVSVELLSFGTDDVLGACGARVAYSFPPPNPITARHFSLIKPASLDRITIALNSDVEWDFRVVTIFRDGFDSGDTSGWDVTVP